MAQIRILSKGLAHNTRIECVGCGQQLFVEELSVTCKPGGVMQAHLTISDVILDLAPLDADMNPKLGAACHAGFPTIDEVLAWPAHTRWQVKPGDGPTPPFEITNLQQAGGTKTPVRGNVVSAFTCPKCGRTSNHPEDVRQRYCGACREFME